MYIAYSALRNKQKNGKAKPGNKQLTDRYEGYYTACEKYREEIMAIQKYIPGWQPPFKREA